MCSGHMRVGGDLTLCVQHGGGYHSSARRCPGSRSSTRRRGRSRWLCRQRRGSQQFRKELQGRVPVALHSNARGRAPDSGLPLWGNPPRSPGCVSGVYLSGEINLGAPAL